MGEEGKFAPVIYNTCPNTEIAFSSNLPFELFNYVITLENLKLIK